MLYAVARSMVRMLLMRDRRALLPMVGAMKDGTPPEEALQRHYGMTYQQFATEWSKWVVRNG